MKRMRCPGCSRHCSADNLKCRRGRAYFEKKIAEEKAQDGPKYKWERYVTQGSAVKELLTAAAMVKKALKAGWVKEEEILNALNEEEREQLAGLMKKVSGIKEIQGKGVSKR